jgi:hypothetical protein
VTDNGEDIVASPCTRAEELVQQLTSDAEVLRTPSRFLFRGTFDARYLLLPSALRETPPPFGKLATTEAEQANLERLALRHFFDAAHYEGLRIPDWQATRRYLAEGTPNYIAKGGPLDVLPLEFMALAQHHGTPTRLLDWTLDPLVAAYFAATVYNSDTAKKVAEMAVWRLDTDWNPKIFPWNVVHIPYDLNSNARAQRGVFVAYRRLHEDGESVRRETMIKFARDLDKRSGENQAVGKFNKLTLPRTEAPNLLRLLRARRVSAAMLFPGYDGCARHERELTHLGEASP